MNGKYVLWEAAEERWLALEGPHWSMLNKLTESDQTSAELVRARDYVAALERLAAELAEPTVVS